MPEAVRGAEANEKVPAKKKNQQLITWIGGGAALVLVLVIYFANRSSQNAQSEQQAASDSGYAGGTGIAGAIAELESMGLLGSGGGSSGVGGGVGGTGPAGPAGPTGKTGPAGPAGPGGVSVPPRSPGQTNSQIDALIRGDIPDLIGMPAMQAIALLHKFGYKTTITGGNFNQNSRNYITSFSGYNNGQVNLATSTKKPALSSSPYASGGTYTVKAGDTLHSIAQRFQIPGGEANLYAINAGMIGNGFVHPGMRLKI